MRKNQRSNTTRSNTTSLSHSQLFFLKSKSATDTNPPEAMASPRLTELNDSNWPNEMISFEDREDLLRKLKPVKEGKSSGIYKRLRKSDNKIVTIVSPKGSFRFSLYLIGDKLGDGAAGGVYRAQDLISGEYVAVKILKTNGLQSQTSDPEKFALTSLGRLKAFFVEHVGIIECEQVYLFQPYFGRCNLSAFLYPKDKEHDFKTKLMLSIGIVKECLNLHNKGILHRDLKPENFMVQQQGDDFTISVVDFGEACPASNPPEDGLRGTFGYQAPEKEYSKASDIYAIGIILADIFSTCDFNQAKDDCMALREREGFSRPMNHKEIQTALEDVLSCDAKLIEDLAFRIVIQLIQSMTSTHPEERQDARAVMLKLQRILQGGVLTRTSSDNELILRAHRV